MATSPPVSPVHLPQRPLSAISRPAPRSASRMSNSSKSGGPSRASDYDSRTAVRVVVRVRPPLEPTDPGFDLIPQRFQRSMVQVTSDTSLAADSPQGRKLFLFDRVFGPEVMQDGIWDYLADSINAFTQGYNVSLLAYGQSGAGKSYTMGTSGPKEQQDLNMMGVIPRAASALFDKLDLPKDRHDVPSPNTVSNFVSQLRNPRAHGQQSLLGDRNWSLKATYVEIYNEQLRDLLVPESTPPHERGNVAIREDAKGNIVLTGLRQMDIYSVDDLMNALNFGSSIRQTDATAINAKSSRSHAVFSLHLVQRKSQLHANSGSEKRFSVPVEAITGREVSVTTDSKLHFVDLAGSERLKNTGAQGDRAKEGISINAGLAALGKVISQLSSRQSASHVSYRDSKLTRLLQDSLGGNAVTYMIACVTPAEFHLSETLNTVQYAQRARAIQSKPRIQSVEDGDNQALIDRLRAEVSFLRDQIRSTSGDTCSPWRGSAPPFERLERQNEREVELQNQLLEAQENYNTLSQRHAKLISEMAKARELESNGVTETILGDSATDRLNRSSSFAEAVEQVVLEYEKTIQTLEQSLSTARISLTNTESSLLEKESKFAYVETINGQLQSRLHKLMERETATETYLRDLEAKLDGHTNGEEKNASIIQELRKETARARGNEASCEEYISTLEERLAEADQDSELMQREIDRLEQVVERQRSLGRLDALLHELDHVEGVKSWENESTNGTTARGLGNLSYHSRGLSHVSRQSQLGDTILEDEELLDRPGRQNRVDTGDSGTEDFGDGESQATERAEGLADQAELQPSRASMSQTKFAADNMEMLCQELVHLRNEHERTVLEFDQLHKKHDDALRTIAELQDVVDEARHPTRIGVRDSVASVTVDTMHMRPLSATFDAKSRSSASRSLSSELSSAIESPATACTSNADDCLDDETTTAKRSESALGESMHGSGSGPLAAELDRLRILAEERGAAERALAEKYAELEFKHNESLLAIENLKAKVHKARAVEANSLRQSTPVIRRKSSQNVMIIDRAHRCFASLRNIASENFEDRPEVMRNFELNLNAAMHELHLRSERIQELEANVASTKKEMETKMTIISGLTRERSSLKAGPMDMSMVVNLRDQLEQSEKQLSELRDSHAARERELVAELENARRNFGSGNLDGEDSVPMRLPETELGALVQQLEARVESLTFELVEAQARTGEEGQDCGHQDLIEFLRGEADGYKTLVQSNANKVIELESALESAKSSLDEMTEAHAEATTDAAQRQELVSELEKKIAAHTDETQTIQAKLETLQSEHVKELADLKVLEQKAYEEQAAVLMAEHGDSIRKLEADIAEIRGDLVKIATQISAALGTDVSIEKLPESIDLLVADHEALVEAQKKEAEMQKHVVELASANEEMRCDLETAKSAVRGMLPGDGNHSVHSNATLADQLSAAHARLSDLESKNKKHIRLVEELEEQLQSNYDEAQMASNRLSTLQSERNAQLEEARTARAKLQSELDAIREDHALLQAKYHEAVASAAEGKRLDPNPPAIRKSASHTSLPSPPPAIPLPPLPTNGIPTSPSPTMARSPGPGKENSSISQLTEDQEARIRSIEKHLYAERQLTQTLEEALTDLETQSKKAKADCDAWKRRAQELEGEVKELRQRPAQEMQPDNRWSLHAVEEERKKRQAAEAARKQLEERMMAINKGKKKKGTLNCF